MSGFKVYSHFCKKSGLNDSSIFQEMADNCHKGDEMPNKNACCAMQTNPGVTHCEDTDCCNTTEQNFKLSVIFDLNKQITKVKPVYDFIFEEFDVNIDKSFLFDYITIHKPEETNFKWGKSLLLIISNLKTEPNPLHNS